MDIFQALQLAALRDVCASIRTESATDRRKKLPEPDRQYRLRKMFRWYSKTFFTPLHLVEELPLEDIITAWWEEHYEAMSEEDLEAERKALLRDPEDLRRAQMEEDAEDADTWEIIQEEKLAKAQQAVQKLEDLVLKTVPPLQSSLRMSPEPELVSVTPKSPPLPDIKMEFVDDFDFDTDSLGLLADPKRTK